ncbi:hypothetical protein Tco_0976297 [Tanacetum coccineum]|uniref:Uncharacterized protein n=1 Tax=Tanacetum coccineum TaxID=301880 RepID=A0ABQ5EGU7_9ASTR
MKSGDVGVKNSILTPGEEKKRRFHQICEIRKKNLDNICEGKIMEILKGDSSSLDVKSSFESNRGLEKVTDFPLGMLMGEKPLQEVKSQSLSLPELSLDSLGIGTRDEAQAENADFLNKLDDNIKKIIKDQVKEHVKAQVSKILLKIEKSVNEQLEAEVLTHLSNESKTSHVVAANLSELEVKKILTYKMERNKHRDGEDKDEEPFAGSNRGSKRRRDGKEPESTSAPKEKTSKTTGKSTEGSKSHHKSAGESAQAEEPIHTAKDLEEPAHQELETGVNEDQPNEETFQHPDWF